MNSISIYSSASEQADGSPEQQELAKVASLRWGRLVFLIASLLIYGFLLLYPLWSDTDPKKKNSYQRTENLRGRVKTHLSRGYEPISWEHPLGTDEEGRDLLIRLSHGARLSLFIGLISTVTFLLFGISLGVVTGYGRESWWRSLVFYIYNIFNTFPLLLFMLLAVIIVEWFIVEQSIRISTYMILFGIISSPKLAELIRGKIATLKKTAYVHAAVALGLSPWRIIGRHLLWYECRPLIVVQGAYIFGQAILVEVTLTYLKFGVEETPNGIISWGLMARNMAGKVFTGEYYFFVVMAVVALVVFSFHSLAELLNDVYLLRKSRI
jgi:peptide/nickel transport system permease protein